MKNFVFTCALLCLAGASLAQYDTLYSKRQQKIVCKIIEINDLDIKYKPAGIEDGPLYVVNKTTIVKYRLSNGFTELIVPDELSLETEHAEILGNRSVVKIHPFSFVNSQLSFAYEKVLKVGMNLDIEAGYSNSNINASSSLSSVNRYGYRIFHTGGYVKPGIKFFLGQDFSVRGLKYAHPLKGRYVKLDLVVSYANYQDIKMFVSNYNQQVSNYPFGPTQTTTITSDLNVTTYGGFVNYGRQFILGNILTMEYYMGVGFTGYSTSYNNADFRSRLYRNSDNNWVNNQLMHSVLRTSAFGGLSFTGGFRIGYIIPDKNKAKGRPQQGG